MTRNPKERDRPFRVRVGRSLDMLGAAEAFIRQSRP